METNNDNERYIYVDTNNTPLFTKERYVKNDGSKGYAYSHVVNGEIIKTMPHFPNGTPLYNLHRLAKYPDQPVYLVEGEKCVETLTKLGVLATTSGGASSDEKADWSPLAGRKVIAWADNDEAGKSYIEKATKKLIELNATVNQINIEALNLTPKGDCVDWLEKFEANYSRTATKIDLDELPLKMDLHNQAKTQDFETGDTTSLTVSLIKAESVKIKPYEWLWDGWLAKGKLHVFAGTAGTGKTTIAMKLAATISTGGQFPDGSKCPLGSVLIWSGEDAIDDTLAPRLVASGACVS